jgi:hypothetical protein
MQFKREFINGLLIFAGIAVYFLIMELAGLSNNFYLRILNVFIVIWGVNRNIKGNVDAGVRGYFTNFLGGFIASMIGAVISIVGLYIYIVIRGGQSYLANFAQTFIFGGGELTLNYFSIALLLESVAASLMVTFSLMQYWKDKVEVINKID